MIPHSRPTLDRDDAAAVLAVLESGQIAQGKEVSNFEHAFASFIGGGSCVAVGSGTAALHLSLLALDIGKGDEVIIPSYVCPALLNAVRYVCATPILADIDPKTFNMDARDAMSKATGRTKAIILPHMFGLPAGIDEFISLRIPIIEDCALSIGSRYKGLVTGSFGAISIFSFYATKMLATGEGGMVYCRDEGLARTIRDLRDYDEKPDYRVRYNYKMTDLQAALGISQLKKVPSFIERRREIAGFYSFQAKSLGLSAPFEPEGCRHVFYRYILLMDRASEFISIMNSRGIGCRRPVFRPIHDYLRLPGYPSTEEVHSRAVSIPIYPSLTDGEMMGITEQMKTFIQ